MGFDSLRKQSIDYSFSAAPQPGSDRTWSTCRGITFASNHESSPFQSASYLSHGQSSQETSLQKDPWPWAESQTQKYDESRGDNREGLEHLVSTQKATSPIDSRLGSATGSPSSNNEGHSPQVSQSQDRPPLDDETFRSPLGFHIPRNKLRDAMLAEPFSTASYWHFTLYQGPGGERVKVHYCKNKDTTEKIAQLFLDQEVIGFDIEWKPNSSVTDGITKNVALIQIASEERVLLAHIARYPNAATSEKEQRVEDFVAPTLKKIMYGISQYRIHLNQIASLVAKNVPTVASTFLFRYRF